MFVLILFKFSFCKWLINSINYSWRRPSFLVHASSHHIFSLEVGIYYILLYNSVELPPKRILSSCLVGSSDQRFCNAWIIRRRWGKKSHKKAVKNYCALIGRNHVLESLTDHLTICWLGLNALKVDNISSHVRVIT